MKRYLMSFAAAAMLLPAAAIAGEETTSSAREAGQLGTPRPSSPNVIVRPGPADPRPNWRPDRPPQPVYRPPHRPPVIVHRPPPVIYYPAPSPRLGWTCETPRFECDLSRPRPIGDECSCRSPSGARRWGVVTP